MTRMIAIRNARLKAAQVRWAREDKARGNYSTYRNGRPYAPTKRVNRKQQQLKETLVTVAAITLLILCAGIAGGLTGV